MGRRKSKPHRSGGIIVETNATAETELNKHNVVEAGEEEKSDFGDIYKPYFVEVDRSGWLSNEHLDISEVVLSDLNLREGFNGFELSEDLYQDPQFSLRFRLCNVGNDLGRIKLGHWPVLPYTDIHLEFVKRDTVDNTETCTVLLSGIFDGPDEGVSGLVHLASLKFVALRAVLGIRLSEDILSLRVRVEVLKSAFDACESLLEGSRKLWRKSMMNVMSWLRPEIMTSEIKYGFSTYMEMEVDFQTDMAEDGDYAARYSRFDPAGFYEAIKPSKAEPMLEDDIPELLPELRPYQRRAAFWMVKREKEMEESQRESERNQFHAPLCVPVDFLDTRSKMFFNPFSGNISLCPETSSPYVFGGILADEMGLGKTVELLACIFAHRRSAYGSDILIDSVPQVNGDEKVTLKRLKRERVECICGAVSDNLKYEGLWVQCDICDAWQHADCVGYSPEGKSLKSKQGLESKTYNTTIELRNGEYVCQMCSELIQATESPIASGATLIVCPAPILPQWHDEIIRHTHPGALKTCIYEGVRDTSFSNSSLMDISDLASADIVLTTYDVLKDDLFHDSDRHIGDRHLLRLQKRYPVIPTLLTRIYWWRICLDEAQMVERTVATAATEMALRLHSKHRWCITGTPIQRKFDDLYGLLRFVKISPFNIYRWWSEVIRDPYEKGDMGAIEFTHRIFKQIMWRSSKQHVADELDLPSQEECLSWLTLSPVEEHFYQRQHEACVRDSHDVIESLREDILNRKVPDSVSSSGSSDPLITHAEAGKLLNALLKLRQACCHPQVGSSSGLRSLQQSPMTMEEVLMVLISKTKIEGEEALRKLVISLNALAAVVTIQNDFSQAALLYNEALTLAEEHSEDFRLDPLLNIHIHHNFAEIFPLAENFVLNLPSKGKQFSRTYAVNTSQKHFIVKDDHGQVKRQKIGNCSDISLTGTSSDSSNVASSCSESGLNDRESDDFSASSVKYLKSECEDSKQKYLSVFSSKLAAAQQEFQSSYMQVCNTYQGTSTNQNSFWWLEALDHAEKNKDCSTELIRKIEEAISGNSNNSKSSTIAARFRSISSLKYEIQTGLDQLEASRKVVLDRLLEIDQTMENPKDEDIERAGKCRNCLPNCDGPPCVLCELDELFQHYEARLFVLKNERGDIISSAEEAVDFQKKNFALNHFHSKLSQSNHSSSVSVDNEESRKRNVGQKVVTSRSASILEVLLGVIKNYCKTRFERDSVSAATKTLHILEGMRKEFVYARSLALAQAQYLRAHDEIKMAVSRLHLRENEDDKSLDALGENELYAASSNFTQEKFMSLALLSQIKGKLRYLKGLVKSKQKLPLESPDKSSCTQDTNAISNSTEEKGELISKTYEETCPICQEKLGHQRMVFQCGHVTCCKCLFAMTEKRLKYSKTIKWVMCPTCRQHTDFGNIAYAVDGQKESPNSSMLHTIENCEKHEASITVEGSYGTKHTDFGNIAYAVDGQKESPNSSMLHTIDNCEKHEASITVEGSYGTKIEAVTRRILWIKATNHKSKVLVFSSWNDVLDVLEHAFAANNITFVRMKGGRKAHTAISQFRGLQNGTKECEGSEPKSIQVLLLLIQHGANGLNLLEAQHVVLVEPLLNPAAEAQAISRVHRIGQKQKTLIHRFLVKDTVEESIYKLNRSRSNNIFISGNKKNQDQPVLTLKDVESLLARAPLTAPEIDKNPNTNTLTTLEIEENPDTNTNLRDLPPSLAAAIAAERRHNQQRT